MAEVTNALMFEVLKSIQRDVAEFDKRLADVLATVQALRGDVEARDRDLAGIEAILTRHDARLDRIERRLDIAGAV